MHGFTVVSIISVLMIALTSVITYEILGVVWNILPRLAPLRRMRVLLIIVPIFAAHIIAIWLYGLMYLLLELKTPYGHLTGSIAPAAPDWDSYVERLYFSASTYASLGLGDIAPNLNLRMLATAEVLNGLVLIGWTVSFTFLAMEKFWSHPGRIYYEGQEHRPAPPPPHQPPQVQQARRPPLS